MVSADFAQNAPVELVNFTEQFRMRRKFNGCFDMTSYRRCFLTLIITACGRKLVKQLAYTQKRHVCRASYVNSIPPEIGDVLLCVRQHVISTKSSLTSRQSVSPTRTSSKSLPASNLKFATKVTHRGVASVVTCNAQYRRRWHFRKHGPQPKCCVRVTSRVKRRFNDVYVSADSAKNNEWNGELSLWERNKTDIRPYKCAIGPTNIIVHLERLLQFTAKWRNSAEFAVNVKRATVIKRLHAKGMRAVKYY